MNDPSDDSYLDDLAAVWKTDASRGLTPSPGQLQGGLWRNRLGLAAELLVASAGTGFGAYVLLHGNVAPGVAAMLYSLAAGAVALWARLSGAEDDLAPTDSHLRALLAMQNLRVKTGWGGIAVIAMALLFMASLVLMDAQTPAYAQQSWAIAGALVFVAGGMLWSVRTLTTALLSRERLRHLSRDMEGMR